MVKIAPATRASPTEAAVRVMFCSRMPPRNAGMRNSAIAITAAGIVAATVWPARMPRYAFAAPKTNARKIPRPTAFTVISRGDWLAPFFNQAMVSGKAHFRFAGMPRVVSFWLIVSRGARTLACRVRTLRNTCTRISSRRSHECERCTHECARYIRHLTVSLFLTAF